MRTIRPIHVKGATTVAAKLDECSDGTVSLIVELRVPRVCCAEHGVRTAAVPWAKHDCRFTLDFAYSVAWMLKCGLNKTSISNRMHIFAVV